MTKSFNETGSFDETDARFFSLASQGDIPVDVSIFIEHTVYVCKVNT